MALRPVTPQRVLLAAHEVGSVDGVLHFMHEEVALIITNATPDLLLRTRRYRLPRRWRFGWYTVHEHVPDGSKATSSQSMLNVWQGVSYVMNSSNSMLSSSRA